jgi:tetratricopeptide (TPR) repeat protein
MNFLVFSPARLPLTLFLLAAPAILPAEDPFVPAEDSGLSSTAAPSSPETFRRRARAVWDQRKTSAAPWLFMGRAYEAEGRAGKALKAFAKALKADPLAAEAYYHRGRLFEAKNRWDEAANEYQAALKVNGNYAEAKSAWEALSRRLEMKEAGKN